MSAFFQCKGPRTYEDTGTSCAVPNNDVAKVSYYLHCVTVGCGLDIIVDDLVDYENVHKLSQARQDSIFEVAYSYSPKEMVGKTIFSDSDQSFTSEKSNVFLKITECTSVVAVTSSIVLGGKETEIKKVMLYTDSWLASYWAEPMKRNVYRIERAMGKASTGVSGGRSSLAGIAAALGRALAESAEKAAKLRHCS